VNNWESQIVEPTGHVPEVELLNTADIDVELEFVNGCRSRDVRNGVGYTVAGKIVYLAASLGIVYDKNTDQQRYQKPLRLFLLIQFPKARLLYHCHMFEQSLSI
jgi:hypothetical protein